MSTEKKEVVEINEDTIQKALETINNFVADLQKAETEEKESEEEKKKEKDLEKAERRKELDKQKEELEKAYSELEKEEIDKEASPEEKKDKVEKCNTSKMEKSSDKDDEKEEIKKSLNSITNVLKDSSLLLKGLTDQISTIKEENKELRDQISKAHEEIETLSKQPVGGRKSFTHQAYIEKAFSVDEKSGKKQLHTLAHRSEISDLLFEKAQSCSDVNQREKYEQACLLFESSGVIEKSIQNELSRIDNIEFVS